MQLTPDFRIILSHKVIRELYCTSSMTPSNPGPKMSESMSEPKHEPAGESHMGIRLVLLLIPVPLTARLLAIWLPFPVAVGGSFFAWMLLIYWIPWRANISFGKWLLIVGASSITACFLAVVVPRWF